jgi:hypothetical protein
MPSLTEHGPLRPPPVLSDDNCKDLDTIKAVLQDHALINGYAINVDCSTAIKAAWVCSKSGHYNSRSKNKDVLENKRRKNTSTTKTDCKFRVSASRKGGMP